MLQKKVLWYYFTYCKKVLCVLSRYYIWITKCQYFIGDKKYFLSRFPRNVTILLLLRIIIMFIDVKCTWYENLNAFKFCSTANWIWVKKVKMNTFLSIFITLNVINTFKWMWTPFELLFHTFYEAQTYFFMNIIYHICKHCIFETLSYNNNK